MKSDSGLSAKLDHELMVLGGRVARTVADAIPGLHCWHQPADEADERRIVLGLMRSHDEPALRDLIHCVSMVFLPDGIGIQEKRFTRQEIEGGFAVENLSQRGIGRSYSREDFHLLERDLAHAVAARPDAFEPLSDYGIGTKFLVPLALGVARQALEETVPAFAEVGGLHVELNDTMSFGVRPQDIVSFHAPGGEKLPVILRLDHGRIEIFDPSTYRTLGVSTERDGYADLKERLVAEMLVYGTDPEDSPRP